MGKGSRKRISYQEKMQKRESEQKALAAQKKKNLTIGILVAVVLIVAIVGLAVWKVWDENYKDSGEGLRNKESITSDNFAIDNAVVTYVFNSTYKQYVTQNSDYITYLGLNTSASLKNQKYPFSQDTTWFDFFMNQTVATLSQVVYLCEGAKDNGVTLDEKDYAEIDSNIEFLQKQADSSGVLLNDYISAVYGTGVKEQDVRKYFEHALLASKYYTQVMDSFSYTDEEYDAYYDLNKNDFLLVDIMSYTFNSGYTDDMTEEQIAAQNQINKEKADRLAAAKTQSEFEAILTEILSAEETDENTEEVSKETLTAVEKAYQSGYAYNNTTDQGKWAFAEERAEGDSTVIEGEKAYSTYLILKTAYRDESLTKNVRHILLKTADKSEEIKQKAQEVLDEFLAGEQTPEAFAALSDQYNEDPGSSSNGGLYENIQLGDMVTEFEDWCFDENRKTGDTGIVETSYGYHIMYFEGDGYPDWKVEAETAMEKNDYTVIYEAIQEKHPLTVNDSLLNKISA